MFSTVIASAMLSINPVIIAVCVCRNSTQQFNLFFRRLVAEVSELIGELIRELIRWLTDQLTDGYRCTDKTLIIGT